MAGATGLVGREILQGLLADDAYAAVHCLVRRPLDLKHRKLQVHLVDFSALGAVPAADDVFVALGTTIKVAGSQQAFRAVDFEAFVAVARAGRAHGATRLGAVSAMGADPRSRVFYSRVKGEAEQAIGALGYGSVSIARPSILSGDRSALQQPERRGEGMALAVSRWLGPLVPANYRVIPASSVAAALRAAVKEGRPGVRILLSGELQRLHA